MRGADNSVRRKLAPFVDRMVTVSQKMSPMGNTPWWQQVPSTDDKMGYECDGKLGAPVAQDCANVEFTDMAPDDGTISVGAGVVKLLSSGQCPGKSRTRIATEHPSGTCQVAIAAATTITLNWRQIRTAMDTLFNICINPPLHAGTGGYAYYRPPPTVSRRSQWGKRQETDDELSGKWDALKHRPLPPVLLLIE